MAQLLSIADMKLLYPSKWVLAGNPVMDKNKIDILEGIPPYHSKDKTVNFDKIIFIYTESFKPSRKMIRRILTLFFLLIAFVTKGQTDTSFTHIAGDTLVIRSGFSIVVGQNIKIGTGTHASGGFEYITEASIININRFFYKNQEEASNDNRITWVLAGEDAKVVELRKTGKKNRKPTYFIKIQCGLTKYWCDIENAIAAREVIPPNKLTAAN